MSLSEQLDAYFSGLSALHFSGLLFLLGALVAVLVLAHRLRLHLTREAGFAILRGAIQLAIVALVLIAIVATGKILWIGIVLLIMLLAAGWTAVERAHQRGAFPVATLTIAIVTAALVAPLIHLGPFESRPLFLVPITGMVLGNAMNATALGIDRMQRELGTTLPLIEARLALGVREHTAVASPLAETARTAMLPLLNTFKTVGLVHLPGMMTGMLIAGASPIAAAEMQFVIIGVLFVAAGISSTTMALWIRKRFLQDLRKGRIDSWRPRQVDEAGE